MTPKGLNQRHKALQRAERPNAVNTWEDNFRSVNIFLDAYNITQSRIGRLNELKIRLYNQYSTQAGVSIKQYLSLAADVLDVLLKFTDKPQEEWTDAERAWLQRLLFYLPTIDDIRRAVGCEPGALQPDTRPMEDEGPARHLPDYREFNRFKAGLRQEDGHHRGSPGATAGREDSGD